jgi:hypothetical protein
MGMELGITSCLFQPLLLGRLGKALSSSSDVVSAATSRMGKSSRVRRQLGLSSAELGSPEAGSSAPRPATMECRESSGIETSHKPAAGKSAPDQSAAGKSAARK